LTLAERLDDGSASPVLQCHPATLLRMTPHFANLL